MKQTLLLDFDGVILRHQKATSKIISRSEAYANNFLKLKSPRALSMINKEIYKLSGHTVNGLLKMGYEANYGDFNKLVYADLDYDKLFKDIFQTNKEDIQNLSDLRSQCRLDEIDIRLFSNAPDIWCQEILKRMCLPGISNLLPIESDLTLNKPQSRIYQCIEDIIEDGIIHFVDDRFENLSQVCGKDRWRLYLYVDEAFEIDPEETFFGNMRIINKLTQVFDKTPSQRWAK